MLLTFLIYVSTNLCTEQINSARLRDIANPTSIQGHYRDQGIDTASFWSAVTPGGPGIVIWKIFAQKSYCIFEKRGLRVFIHVLHSPL